MGTCTQPRMGSVSLLLVSMLFTVAQLAPLSPAAAGGSPTKGVYVVVGPLNMKSLMPKSSKAGASAAGDDYALTFGSKVSNINLLMEKGADVDFKGDVDNINAEYVSTG